MAKTQFVSLLSGKGGVGKSVLAFNLADQMAELGYRVLVVDADFAQGSIHVLANVNVTFGINEYLTGERTLAESVVSVRGIDLLVATWNHDLAEARSIEQTARFIEKLRNNTAAYDYVLFDHGSGRSNQVVLMAHSSDLNLLVLVPELTSIADAYGLLKQMVTANRSVNCALIVNRASTEEESEFIRTRMNEMTLQFLGVTAGFAGFVLEDRAVKHAVATQKSLAVAAPDSTACKQINQLAQVVTSLNSNSIADSQAVPMTQINKTTATADIRG